MLTFQSVVTG